MKKQYSKNWGGPGRGQGRKLSAAKTLIRNFGQYRVTQADVVQFGGTWSEDNSCYIFPDGSAGRFTDIFNGAVEQDAAGESVLHFIVVD